MKRVIAAAVALALTGCAPKAFVHPSQAANQPADAAACEYEIEMTQRGGVAVPWWYNNSQATGYLIGAAIGRAIQYDRLRTLCMQAKGYQVVALDAPAPIPIGQPQAGIIAIAPVSPVTYPRPMSDPTGAVPEAVKVAVAPAPVAAAPIGIKGESKYMLTAEGIAKAGGCNPPLASMTEKGAGTELFSIACPNGTAIAIRCEIDGCRVLR